MFRRSPRAALLWCAAVVVATATAVTVGGTLASLRRQDAAWGRIGDLVVARHDLPIGHPVADGDVTRIRTRGGAKPLGAFTTPGAAVGRIVAVPLLRGQAVTARHLAPRRRDGRNGVVAPGWRTMRVPVADTPRVRPGDHVDVFVTFDPAHVAADADPTLTVARAVPVVAIDAIARATTGTDRATGVTLMVRADEAPRLAYASANGVLALALVAPEEARDPIPSR